MRPSGRVIIDAKGTATTVPVDDNKNADNNAAHGYADASIAARRFKRRSKLTPEQAALLATLKPSEQNDLLDKADADRIKTFGELKEAQAAAATKPAPAATKGSTP